MSKVCTKCNAELPETSFYKRGVGTKLRSECKACTIDKIDPTKGYTKDNCLIVCWWYNVTKQRYSDTEVLQLCKQVIAHS